MSRKKSKETAKTNVMRILEQCGVRYEAHDYTAAGVVSGREVAKALGQDPDKAFKTLVAEGHGKAAGAERIKEHYVFVVPVSGELDLKKAAAAVGEKSIAMIREKELLPLTGYVHGGCSPIGMKKPFRTVIDSSAARFDTIMFSAGKIGYQVEVRLSELGKALKYELADIKADI